MGSMIHRPAHLALGALLGFASFVQASSALVAQEPDPFREAMIKVLTGVQPDAVQKLDPAQRSWEKAALTTVALLEQHVQLLAKTKGLEPGKDMEARKAALTHLASVLIGGDGAAEAEAKLFENREAAAAALEHLGKQLQGQRRNLTVGLIQAAFNSGARFAGQFAALKKLGSGMEELLLSTIESPPSGVPDAMRAFMLLAIRDIGHNLDEAQRKRVATLADDQFEDENVRGNAAYLLYACGDKARVEKRIEALRAEAEKSKEPDAYRGLAEVHWSVGEHDQAIAAYKSAIEVGSDMPKNDLATLYYNMACSQALAGKVDDAFATLDKALPMMEVKNRTDLLRGDGDLNNLRKDERFAQLVERFGGKPEKSDKPDKAKGGEAEKAKTGGAEGK